jgi:hypothetical protein
MIAASAPGVAAARVRSREGGLVRAADLTEEQRYRLAMRRGHDRRQHRWGIVSGLALATAPGGFALQPGYAVDGYGRGVVVPDALAIPLGELPGEATNVWLSYGRHPAMPARRGREACGPGKHPRWVEAPGLVLEATEAEAEVQPRCPPDVPAHALVAGAERPAPEDPGRPWPIYLGRLLAAGGGQAVDLRRRPYAGLVGERLRSPRGGAEVQVGLGSSGDERRIAVTLADAAGFAADRLTIDSRGAVGAWGDARLHGALVIEGTPAAAHGVALQPLPAPPADAAPWRLSRVVAAPDGPPANQLRIEIGHPGKDGDPARHRLAIGHVNGAGAFVPCLSVGADRTVTVHGDLEPEGLIVEGAVKADPGDPRFQQAVLDNWLGGAASASLALDTLYAGSLALSVVGVPASVIVGSTLDYTVTAANAGPVAAVGFSLKERLTLGGTTVREAVLHAEAVLPAGEERTVTRSYDVPADAGGEDLVLIVEAIARGPYGYPLIAARTFTRQVSEVIIN